MIGICRILAVALAGGLLANQGLNAKMPDENSPKGISSTLRHKNRRLLVKYKNDVSSFKKDQLHFAMGAYPVKSFEFPHNLELVEVARGISLKAAQEVLAEDPNVLYVEPDAELHAFLTPPPVEPPPVDEPPSNGPDPKYAQQWALNNVGQDGGTPDVDINAPEMWAKTIGNENIVIAVIDTGVNYNHPDLKANIWTNPGEIPGNGVDDDGNGVIDDVHGYNASAKNGDPMDDHGHGSHCAGVIAAESNNPYGGRGILQKAQVIGCKFLSADGRGTTADAIECLEYLYKLKTRSEHPVNIIATSNSWGGPENSEALADAIKAHKEEGILFIAAASNEGRNNDVVDVYPADYPIANIVSVAAIDNQDKKAWFSNYGSRTVHVGAPGVDILSTVLGDDYEKTSGTSMATPHVAGLAGIIKAYYPDADYIRIKNLIMAGGIPTPALEGKTISGRRIRGADTDGHGSITCHDQVVRARLSPTLNRLAVPVGAEVHLSAVSINCGDAYGEEILVPMNKAKNGIQLKDNGIDIDSAKNDGTFSTKWIADQPGKYEFLFPGDDKVVITVYDPTLWQQYELAEIQEFAYRTVEGEGLEALDDWNASIEVPFPVHFAGDESGFEVLNLSSNGVMSFTDYTEFSYDNSALPVAAIKSLIAPYWDDLNPEAIDSNGDIFVGTIGEAPNREFVIEYRNVAHYGSEGEISFQVVFFENSSDILFNYQDTELGAEEFSHGGSATIGVQLGEDRFTQVGYDQGILGSGKSIRFTLAPKNTAE